ncbi:hypothetical protein EDB83DRAFT_2314005 [Lactarius deliciosus]|nr:hypothetical protein EDB83DRAFT_2314005 [Lactarius deliciosus]
MKACFDGLTTAFLPRRTSASGGKRAEDRRPREKHVGCFYVAETCWVGWSVAGLTTLLRVSNSRSDNRLRLGLGWASWAQDVNDPGSLRYCKSRDQTPPSRASSVPGILHLQDDFGSPASLSKTRTLSAKVLVSHGTLAFSGRCAVHSLSWMVVRGCGNSWACSLRFAHAPTSVGISGLGSEASEEDKSSSELGLSNAPVIGNARGRPHFCTGKNLADFQNLYLE